MTEVYDSLKIEVIPGDSRYVRLLEQFRFYSDTVSSFCFIPRGFVFDLESVPVIRGTNPEAGAIHDYFCRIDSYPVVDKETAAKIYFEFQAFYDRQESGNWFNRIWDWIRRRVKTRVVEVAPDYFHKFSVMATYEELRAG